MSQPKITVFTPALGHPELLARMISCFEHQTWENRELVILEDGCQLDPQSGDRWEIVPVKRRYRSLAEKNNACIALASFDSQLLSKWDLDDVFLPHALEASVEALSRGEICQPRLACDWVDGEWVQIETFHRAFPNRFAFHSCWSMRRSFYIKMRGYAPGAMAGDDQELDMRRIKAGIPSVGLAPKYPPFMFYNRPLPGRLSTRGDSEQAYIDTAKGLEYVGRLPPYEGEAVWERPVPTKVIPRPW